MNGSNIRILKLIVDNSLTRFFLSHLGYCKNCKSYRIEVVLDLYTGKRDDSCVVCSLANTLFSMIIRSSGQFFGVDEEKLKRRFTNPYWKKGLISVLNGITYFGIRKPFVPGAPFLVVWDITTQCNLQCKHCYSDSGKKKTNELSTDQAKNVIDILDEQSVPIISFSGGEPLVRDDIFELTRYATDKGIYVGIATNGTLITNNIAQKMKDAGVKFVQISIDGASSESHDPFRGLPGMLEKAIEGVKNCVKQDFFVNIATVATKNNLSEIPDIIRLCDELNVKWFMIYNFVPVGRGKSVVTTDLDPSQREEILTYLYKVLKEDEIDVDLLSTAPQFARVALEHEYYKDEKTVPTHFLNSIYSEKLFQLAEFIGGCGCGRFYCALRSNGDIEPCVFFSLTVGNIFDNDFSELWKYSSIFSELRDRDKLNGSCGNCEYKYFCGGCRARSYAYTNNYLSPDPGCIRNKKEHQQIAQTISN